MMRCTRMSHKTEKVQLPPGRDVPFKYRSAARLCRFIARSLASSCSTLYLTASAYRLSPNALFCFACRRSCFFSAFAYSVSRSARTMIESRLPPETTLDLIPTWSDSLRLRTASFFLPQSLNGAAAAAQPHLCPTMVSPTMSFSPAHRGTELNAASNRLLPLIK